jgi:hypothetical protein
MTLRRPGSNALRGRAFGVLMVCACACGPSSGSLDDGESPTTTSSSSSGGASSSAVTTSEDTTPSFDTTTSLESWTATSSSSTAADSTTGYVSHCEVPPDLPPVCWDVVCEQFECGPAASVYDAEGCPRPLCEGTADCDAPAFCLTNLLASSCKGGDYGGWSCAHEFDQCVCGGGLGCGADPRGYCTAPDEAILEDVCLASAWPCDELFHPVSETHQALVEFSADMPDELLAQSRDCQRQRIDRLLGECAVAPCDMLCAYLPKYTGCAPMDCSACESADPAEVIEILQALVDRSLPCADCALCDELQSELCGAIAGC